MATPKRPPIVAIIPARLGSTRFPRKMLADATGRPLIVHTLEAAKKSTRIERVVVATEAEAIAQAVRACHGEVVMTSPAHPNGTSRLAEAASRLGLHDETVVVNIQGDEPEIDPEVVDLAIETLLADGEAQVATVGSPFHKGEKPDDPNIVKVVVDCRGRAMYFSRRLIPYNRDDRRAAAPLKHVGVYVYRVGFLLRYIALPKTPLEQTEQLEQLRILEHGYPIAVAVTQTHHVGIDTETQYQDFVSRQTDA